MATQTSQTSQSTQADLAQEPSGTETLSKDKEKVGQAQQVRETYQLWLYIMGMSRQSVQALRNLRHICKEYLADCYQLEVIDLERQPEPVAEDGFIVAPMLIKNSPLPVRKFIGNLANTQELLRQLDLADDALSI